MTSGSDPNRPAVLGGPAVILVEPQLGENIGTAARAMLNCGLTDLRLVRPRDRWPNDRAVAASSGADAVLAAARLFSTAAEAVADLTRVYATTARNRGMTQAILTPRAAATDMRAAWDTGEAVGILFGPERTGLFNDDLTLADALISVPLNPQFSSLNLAQSVLLISYEWYQTGSALPPDRLVHTGQSPTATKAELINLFEHLEQELDVGNFWSNPEKRPTMVRNIRNAFERMGMTRQEVRTFHGIIACLAGRAKPKL